MSSFSLRAFCRRSICCFYTHSFLSEVHPIARKSYKGNCTTQSQSLLQMALYPAINGWFNYLKFWKTMGLYSRWPIWSSLPLPNGKAFVLTCGLPVFWASFPLTWQWLWDPPAWYMTTFSLIYWGLFYTVNLQSWHICAHEPSRPSVSHLAPHLSILVSVSLRHFSSSYEWYKNLTTLLGDNGSSHLL